MENHQKFCRVRADLLKGATGSADDDEYMKKQREMEEVRKKAEEEARAEAVSNDIVRPLFRRIIFASSESISAIVTVH